MVATQPEETSFMTEAEYLAFEDASEFKHEYNGGHVYAMTGASVRHNTIVMNIGVQLSLQLADRNCTTNAADTRVHIASKGTYRYPDVTVFCGDPAYWQDRTDTITNPVVLVEVLSPESALRDYNEKLAEYTQFDTLQFYLVVSQHTPKVERYMRDESGQWLYNFVTGLEGEIALPTLDCTLALSQVYRQISFEEADKG